MEPSVGLTKSFENLHIRSDGADETCQTQKKKRTADGVENIAAFIFTEPAVTPFSLGTVTHSYKPTTPPPSSRSKFEIAFERFVMDKDLVLKELYRIFSEKPTEFSLSTDTSIDIFNLIQSIVESGLKLSHEQLTLIANLLLDTYNESDDLSHLIIGAINNPSSETFQTKIMMLFYLYLNYKGSKDDFINEFEDSLEKRRESLALYQHFIKTVWSNGFKVRPVHKFATFFSLTELLSLGRFDLIIELFANMPEKIKCSNLVVLWLFCQPNSSVKPLFPVASTPDVSLLENVATYLRYNKEMNEDDSDIVSLIFGLISLPLSNEIYRNGNELFRAYIHHEFKMLEQAKINSKLGSPFYATNMISLTLYEEEYYNAINILLLYLSENTLLTSFHEGKIYIIFKLLMEYLHHSNAICLTKIPHLMKELESKHKAELESATNVKDVLDNQKKEKEWLKNKIETNTISEAINQTAKCIKSIQYPYFDKSTILVLHKFLEKLRKDASFNPIYDTAKTFVEGVMTKCGVTVPTLSESDFKFLSSTIPAPVAEEEEDDKVPPLEDVPMPVKAEKTER